MTMGGHSAATSYRRPSLHSVFPPRKTLIFSFFPFVLFPSLLLCVFYGRQYGTFQQALASPFSPLSPTSAPSSDHPGHGPYRMPPSLFSHYSEFSSSPVTLPPTDAPKSDSLNLLYGLFHRNTDAAEALLRRVSSPSSSSYGAYLPVEYWREHHSPSASDIERVRTHIALTFPGRQQQVSLSGDFVRVGPCTVGEVEKAYNTTVVEYRHPEMPERVALRANTAMHLPEEIQHVVEFVNLAAPLHYYSKNHSYQKHRRRRNNRSFSPTSGLHDLPIPSSSSSHYPPIHHSEVRRDSAIGLAEHRPSVGSTATISPPPAEPFFPKGIFADAEFEFRYPDYMPSDSARGIAPMVNPNSFFGGDGFLVVSFMPYCKDGKPNDRSYADGGRICGKGDTHKMQEVGQRRERRKGDPSFDESVAEIVYEEVPPTPPSYNLPMSSYGSLSADGRQKVESDEASIIGFEVIIHQLETEVTKIVELPSQFPVLGSQNTVCGSASVPCVSLNTTIAQVPNYAQTRISIRSRFSTGEFSPFSPYSEVHAVWPLPYMTPSTLANLYGIPVNLPISTNRSNIAVAEFLDQYYNQTDLDEFFRLTGVPKQTPPLVLGPNDQVLGGVNGTEAQLDIQYIMSLASNVSTWFWSVPGRNAHTNQEPFLEWLFEISNTADRDIPLVHSISYGDDEAEMELWYAKRLNMEFLKMGLRGLTVLTSSGDDGASGYHTRTNSTFCRSSRPELPAALPYVTAVGGTQLSRNSAKVCGLLTLGVVMVECHFDKEKVCMANTGGGITSGGGFSNYFERPWYQEKLVQHYIDYPDSPLPLSSFFNPRGRAYPDLSAYANNFLVLMDGRFELVHGTSASTPVMAAMIAHFNDMRLSKGLPPLGFLNPLLYHWGERYPQGFNDILVGDNRCGISPYICCKHGFEASRGWDAVTGLGTPRFDVLADVLSKDMREKWGEKMEGRGEWEGAGIRPAIMEMETQKGEVKFVNTSSDARVEPLKEKTAFELFFQAMGMFGLACTIALFAFLVSVVWKEYLKPKICGDGSRSFNAPPSSYAGATPSGPHNPLSPMPSSRTDGDVLLSDMSSANPYVSVTR